MEQINTITKQDTTSYCIGFTEKYYTLWVMSPAVVGMSYSGYYYDYIQNLSMDFEEAKSRLKEICGVGDDEFEVDLTLRGANRIFRSAEVAEFEFSFGLLRGQDIRTSNDVWQLRRAAKSETTDLRKQYAIERLQQLSVALEEQIIPDPVSGQYFTNGEKVKLIVSEFKRFWFDSMYGRTAVVIYREIGTNREFKYVGNSPAAMKHADGFLYIPAKMVISGTISHSVYKGMPETKLKRVKILNLIED